MADAYKGKWKLTDSTHFDEYMKKLGVGFITRKAGNTVKPVVTITIDRDNWDMTSVSTFKTIVTKFTLNQEFDETTPDGRHVKTTFRLEDGKLIQEQKGEVDSTMAREIKEDKMIVTCTIPGWDGVCTRTYTKVH